MSNEFAYPRPEYPRPERQRGTLEGYDWLNLNGPWQFRFDATRTEIDAGWHMPDDLEWREQIIVPFCWESLAAWGEADAAGNENYYSTRPFLDPLQVRPENHRAAPRYEVGWYRRWITIPNDPPWHGKRVILTIGAADFFTDGWCNGKPLGHHEGGYTPFEFDLSDTLAAQPDGSRTGLLVLRVEDPMDNHEQPVGKQWRWYTTTSGIWQTAFIEPRHATHIESFRVFTDIDTATARFSVDCCDCENCHVTFAITFPDGQTKTVTASVKDKLAEAMVQVDPLRLWNPNDPHLYPLVLSLSRNGDTLDSIRSYFGMRKIDFASRGGQAPVALRLNGVPRYLRGALHQSYYPDGVYTAGDAATLKNDILFAKKVGFNFLRVHIKIDDPLLLHYADKYGMLIMADFPNFGEGGDTPLGRERFERMMRDGIRRDFNHPSIFAWCIFNETWGFGGQSEFKDLIYPLNPKQQKAQQKVLRALSGQQVTSASPGAIAASTEASNAEPLSRKKLANLQSHAWVQQIWELAKKLDPTRLVEDMSVCHWEHLEYFGHGDTDINSWHFYINDYHQAKEHIDKIVKSTFVGSTFNYVPGYQHKGAPLINSEYGGIGALDGDVDVSWSFKFLTNELRRHPQISAYIYTELHDVEWEHNGFLNYDRTPKDFGYDPTIINESDVLPIDAPPASRVSPGEHIRLRVDSSHYSSRPHKSVTLQWRLGAIDTRGRWHQDLVRGAAPIPFRIEQSPPRMISSSPCPTSPH
ncbi:MAG: glycoside hydrolase family 2 [Verrucomicrobia subdivision 3 bacterium]|nr:glycoside hydrolase family 2 [Limisphaerales bacterium]